MQMEAWYCQEADGGVFMEDDRVIEGRGAPAVGVPGCDPDAALGLPPTGWDEVELDRPRDWVRRAAIDDEGEIVPR